MALTEVQPPEAPAVAPPPKSGMARLRARVEALSESPHAFWAMMGVSVIDASVFPIPPFAILVPMCLANPKKAWQYSLAGAVASILGGLIGYGIGTAVAAGLLSAFHIDMDFRVAKILTTLHLPDFGLNMTLSEALGKEFWILALLSSVLPTPYKLVTIGSGMVHVPLDRFILASIIGRSARFFGFGLFSAYASGGWTKLKAKRELKKQQEKDAK